MAPDAKKNDQKIRLLPRITLIGPLPLCTKYRVPFERGFPCEVFSKTLCDHNTHHQNYKIQVRPRPIILSRGVHHPSRTEFYYSCLHKKLYLGHIHIYNPQWGVHHPTRIDPIVRNQTEDTHIIMMSRGVHRPTRTEFYYN